MSVRKLEFTLSAGGISPQTVQPGGVQFEHNATNAVFIIPNALYELIAGIGENKTVLYRVDAIDGEGGYHVSETIEPTAPAEDATEYHLIYPIPYDVSSIGGTCQLTVVATRIDENSAEEMIYCSETAFIQFSHVSRSSLQHDKFKTELGGILNEAKGYMIESAAVDDSGKLYVRYVNGKTVYVGVSNLLSTETITAAIDATNNANKAAENAQSAAEEANEAADDAAAVRQEIEKGGFIESLKETNNGDKFTFWVGTEAEYEALTEIVENCFYLITDDTTTADLKAFFESIPEKNKLLYEGEIPYGEQTEDIYIPEIVNYSMLDVDGTLCLVRTSPDGLSLDVVGDALVHAEDSLQFDLWLKRFSVEKETGKIIKNTSSLCVDFNNQYRKENAINKIIGLC